MKRTVAVRARLNITVMLTLRQAQKAAEEGLIVGCTHPYTCTEGGDHHLFSVGQPSSEPGPAIRKLHRLVEVAEL